MPHIDLKVLAGHSFKFVQFTYRASLLSDTSAYFKTLRKACMYMHQIYSVHFEGNQLELGI